MASFLTVGEHPCTCEDILDLMRRSPRFASLSSRWALLAQTFGVITDLMDTKPENWDGFVLEVLLNWTRTRGEDAILEELCKKLVRLGGREIKDVLMREIERRVKEYFLIRRDDVHVFGKWMKMNDIFKMTSSLNCRPKRNDPSVLVPQSQEAHQFQSSYQIARMVDQFLQVELKGDDFEVLENFSFIKLGLLDVGKKINPKLTSSDDRKALQLIKKLNLTNYGKSFVIWLIAARSILLLKRADLKTTGDAIRIAFEFEEVFQNFEDLFQEVIPTFPRFEKLMLVQFINLLLERDRGYKMRLKWSDVHWIEKYAMACLACNATHLLTHMSQCPPLLHHFVSNTMGLIGEELNAKKRIVSHMLKKNPAALKFLHHDNLPPLLMKNVHVEMIEIMCNNGAEMEVVNDEGRNIVHMINRDLPANQFHLLVNLLLEKNKAHLLKAKDKYGKTPLIVNPEFLRHIEDLPTLNLFASADDDFMSLENMAFTCLYHAVKMKKDVRILEALVGFGADWNWKSWHNETLLHIAAREENLEALRYLVDLGCEINACDMNDYTPLNYAHFCKNEKKKEVIQYLVGIGARMN